VYETVESKCRLENYECLTCSAAFRKYMLQKCQVARKETFDEHISRLSRLFRDEVLTVHTTRLAVKRNRKRCLREERNRYVIVLYNVTCATFFTRHETYFTHVGTRPTILFEELFFANEKYAHGKKGLCEYSAYLFFNINGKRDVKRMHNYVCICLLVYYFNKVASYFSLVY